LVAPSDTKLKCGILGCTGAVGQRFVLLLQGHPFFEIAVLGASERSAGKKYKDAVSWMLDSPLPQAVANVPVVLCNPEEFSVCDLVFSALDNIVAGPIEESFATANIPVFSNAKNHRLDPVVPILIPFANPEHIDVIPKQREAKGYKKGFIVTNANCSTTGLVIALRPLHEAFGIDKLFVVTMQAVSGAGYPGVSSYDIMGNVIPYISGEEDKLVVETNKILGRLSEDKSEFVSADIRVSAQCNRVGVLEGHTECVSIGFGKKVTVDEVKAVLRKCESPSSDLVLPSAPKISLALTEDCTRPQPRRDADCGHGYTVTVGRVRECELFCIKMVVLSHNTVIGAAGGSILNAELARVKGYL